jgi:hypothetical protein
MSFDEKNEMIKNFRMFSVCFDVYLLSFLPVELWCYIYLGCCSARVFNNVLHRKDIEQKSTYQNYIRKREFIEIVSILFENGQRQKIYCFFRKEKEGFNFISTKAHQCIKLCPIYTI